VGRLYRFRVVSVRDMAFNPSGYIVNHYFTAAFDADIQAPQLVGISIGDGYTDVPTNAVLEMQFDEPISGLDLAGLNVLQGGTVVPLQTRTLSDGNRRVRLRLANPLEPNAEYVLRAENTVDLSGNIQSTAVESTFSTGAGANLTALTTIDTSPYSSQTNVATNTRISIQYNQRINPLTLSSVGQLYDTVLGSYVDVVLERDDTVIITPRSSLAANRVYYINYNSGISSLTGSTHYLYLPFTTGSTGTTALTVTDWTIPDGYDAVPVNGSLVIDFNTALDVVSCPIADHVTVSDGVNDIVYMGSTPNIRSRKRLVITPSGSLLANTNYTVTVDGLCDNAGNTIGLHSQDFSTTAITDVVLPSLVSVTPESNATGVDVLTPVVWSFSEPVWYTQGSIATGIYLYVGSTSNKLPGDYTWNADHTVLTFTPSVEYPVNTVIQKYLQYNYLHDLAGNTPSYSV
jgi:large repetitive protein